MSGHLLPEDPRTLTIEASRLEILPGSSRRHSIRESPRISGEELRDVVQSGEVQITYPTGRGSADASQSDGRHFFEFGREAIDCG
jgi:hypothetical protein